MELTKFSIENIVLGTRDLGAMTSKFLLKSFDYIETSISYNNDFELGPILNNKTKIISSISSLDQYDVLLKYHLIWLKRNIIDILLVDAKGSWKNEDFLSLSEKKNDLFLELGLTNVESIDDIKKIQNLGITINWVDITINPTYFNFDLIYYLKENNIKIISHGILGGYLAKTNIEIYSLQFLLSFAAIYSDLVCISGRCCEEVMLNRTLLESCVGKEIDDALKPLYLFSSSRIVRRAPLTSLPLYRYFSAGNFTLKLKGNKDLFSPILVMDDSLETIPEDSISDMDSIEFNVNDGLSKLALPEDCIPDSSEAFAFWRYNTIAIINSMKGSYKYKYKYELYGNVFLIYKEKKSRIFNRHNPPQLYLLAMTETTSLPLFRKIENIENSDAKP